MVRNIKKTGIDGDGNPVYAAVKYGNFIQVTVEFLIIALFIYIVIIQIIKGQARKERLAQEEKAKQEAIEKANPKPVVIPEDIKLLQEIRDLLKKK